MKRGPSLLWVLCCAVGLCAAAVDYAQPALRSSSASAGTLTCEAAADPAANPLQSAGPFWLNRGSGLPSRSTTVTMGRSADGSAYIFTFHATDSLMSHSAEGGFKVVTKGCAARNVTRETFGVLLAQGANTPSSFVGCSCCARRG